jgi:hypothetical protein
MIADRNTTPHKCTNIAKTLTENLQDVWHPQKTLKTTPTQVPTIRGAIAFQDKNAPLTIEDALHIDPHTKQTNTQINELSKDMKIDKDSRHTITVYIAGLDTLPDKEEATAGLGICYGENHTENISLCLPSKQTKMNAMLYTIIKMITDTDTYCPLNFHINSKTLIQYLLDNYRLDKDRGWTNCPSSPAIKKAIQGIQNQHTTMFFTTIDPNCRDQEAIGA